MEDGGLRAEDGRRRTEDGGRKGRKTWIHASEEHERKCDQRYSVFKEPEALRITN